MQIYFHNRRVTRVAPVFFLLDSHKVRLENLHSMFNVPHSHVCTVTGKDLPRRNIKLKGNLSR
jgi:hypothetical protein